MGLTLGAWLRQAAHDFASNHRVAIDGWAAKPACIHAPAGTAGWPRHNQTCSSNMLCHLFSGDPAALSGCQQCFRVPWAGTDSVGCKQEQRNG